MLELGSIGASSRAVPAAVRDVCGCCVERAATLDARDWRAPSKGVAHAPMGTVETLRRFEHLPALPADQSCIRKLVHTYRIAESVTYC
jgi:hypothetical protein